MRQRTQLSLTRQNVRLVKRLYPGLARVGISALRDLTQSFHLSVLRGEILYIDGKWYVTHAGLIRIALRRRCRGIRTILQERQCDPLLGRWVFKAIVYKDSYSKGFVGYGDAEPSNVSSLVHGAEMRIAETRAVNRALRKAYGVGLCSVEELAPQSAPLRSAPAVTTPNGHHSSNASTSGQPRLRDRLCFLIRQFNLDPTLVKAYAADFCGTQTLKDASRDLVESFISHLAEAAKENRDGLVCTLNSYAQPAQVKP